MDLQALAESAAAHRANDANPELYEVLIMDWNRGDLSLNDGMLYANGRYLGTFSCWAAGKEAISIMKTGQRVYSERDTACMDEADVELMLAIDFDER
ncbi:hypothetical protein [Burkholderia pseudomallei]|uniref:hypothetical protein n=1 Tax=Burkholderia pseudomallei TaxID=28450 RepID=UPI000A1A168E|nr:hypothetical protein [Burkholderia pseudomallei]ARK86084.1 hypothetical protein BOC42_00530 [Burkholderia pseudomallei]